MKSIFSVLQKIGRAFMLPIAILPMAGILLGVGGAFTNYNGDAGNRIIRLNTDGTKDSSFTIGTALPRPAICTILNLLNKSDKF